MVIFSVVLEPTRTSPKSMGVGVTEISGSLTFTVMVLDAKSDFSSPGKV